MKLDGFLEERLKSVSANEGVEVLVVVDGALTMDDARKSLDGFEVLDEYPFSRAFRVKARRGQIRELEKKDFVVAINEA